MLSIIKNDWKRLLEQKLYLIIAIVLTILSVCAAILLTNNMEAKGNIAVVGKNIDSTILNSPYFNVIVLDQAPEKSKLVQNEYDAVISKDENGSIDVETIKGEDFRNAVTQFINNPGYYAPSTDGVRHIGTNIIGYMMMFLLMQGVLYARLFADDKEKHVIERVVMSPISFYKYLLGHGIFIMMLIFIPSYSVILGAKMIGINIGFSLLQYAGLMGILAFLSMAFSLCLNSFFCVADTANMLGSSIIVLTSILAGSFYSFSKGESFFNTLLHILPQKDFMNFIDALEKDTLTNQVEIQLLYVILLALVFILIAVIKTRKDYVYHK